VEAIFYLEVNDYIRSNFAIERITHWLRRALVCGKYLFLRDGAHLTSFLPHRSGRALQILFHLLAPHHQTIIPYILADLLHLIHGQLILVQEFREYSR
jgi:hypothetical protein